MADPTTATSAAASANPYGAIAEVGAGIIQSVIGGIRANKAQKQMEKMQSPVYTPNKSILDYYDMALNKYQLSPYNTSMYKKAVQDTGRTSAQALDSLRGRGGAVAGVSNVMANQNNSLLTAAANAEGRKMQEFGVLGNATGMKANETRRAFDINQMAPFERKYNLLAMKAGGGNQVMGAGLSNVFNGANAYNDIQLANKMYSK